MDRDFSHITPFSRGKLAAIISVIVAALFIFTLPRVFEDVTAEHITVIQSLSGELNVYTEPGPVCQCYGTVTDYKRRDKFQFEWSKDAAQDFSIETRFLDGGTARISGAINWTMPVNQEQVKKLHKDFHSMEAIEQTLIRQAVSKAIFNVGSLMTTTESAAEARPDIAGFIDDQIARGPYRTKQVLETQRDPVTHEEKTVKVVKIALDEKGQPLRESTSVIAEYGIGLQPIVITGVHYSPKVEEQILARQQSITDVQLSIAAAKKAEQAKITTEAEGAAAAAKTKWEQEKINAKDIAEAEKKVKVADNAVKEAELLKKAEILKGEGEAARKRLVMEADGQLDKRLAATVEINKMYADAIKSAQPGAWVPVVQMAGRGEGGNNSAQALIDLMTSRAAKEVGVDLSVRQGQSANAHK